MGVTWGIHNDRIPAAELVAGGFVSIAWEEVGDLREIGDDQTALKDVLARTHPEAKPGALPVWAGVLRRFAFEMAEGDLVIAPSKQAPVINIGRVAGPYTYLADAPAHRHRRPVEWLLRDVPRTVFSQGALYEVGSAMTLFQIANHAHEFQDAVEFGVPDAAPDASAKALSGTELVRYGLLQRTVLEVLRDRGVTRRREVLEEVPKRIQFTGAELKTTGNGRSRYENAIVWGSVDMVAAEWLEKLPDGWSLTDTGRQVLEETPSTVDLSERSRAAYQQARAAKRARTGRFTTDRYPLIDEAVKLIGEGEWVTYSDIATVTGSNPSAVGEYVHQEALGLEGHHRVVPAGRAPNRDDLREALEAEGVRFDDHGLPDPRKQVRLEDLREEMDQRGLLPTVPRRAWMVRGSNGSGRDLVSGWLESGTVTLAATSLRAVAPGIGRDQLKQFVDEDYAHASYDLRGEKVDDFHAFLTRMQEGHLVVAVDSNRLYIGTLTERVEQHPAAAGGAILTRGVSWADADGVDLGDIPSGLRTRLKIQRDVVDLTQQLETLEALLDAEESQRPAPEVTELELPGATPELARALHVPQDWLQECIDLLSDRPQLIFYGPPGTGKTYLAQAIGKHLAGDNVRLVQFHPAYSYEDFFEGYRPQADGGFALKPGPLRKIVSQAKENPNDPYVLIIDEINRGNLAKVFGELYFLLEYRTENVELLYADEEFNLPENVFIIGTMNTADRSIALVDAAMRRRFSFLPLHPSEAPTSGILRSWLAATGRPGRVADLLDELNRRIEDPDFKIGPSYVMRDAVHRDGGLERAWRTSILPLLEEHHFGELDAASVAARYGLPAVAGAVDAVAEPVDASPGTD